MFSRIFSLFLVLLFGAFMVVSNPLSTVADYHEGATEEQPAGEEESAGEEAAPEDEVKEGSGSDHKEDK